jgi:hypothetical protein
LDPSTNDPISCTNLLPSSNSNGIPSIHPHLLLGTYISNGLNTIKKGMSPFSPFAVQ